VIIKLILPKSLVSHQRWLPKLRKDMSKGFHPKTEFKKGHKINLGNKHTLGKHWKLSEKTKQKMRKSKRGLTFSEEHKRKIGESCRGVKKKIKTIGSGGYRKSEEQKRKMSEAKRGRKCYLWKGGISFEPYSVDWTETLRRSIRQRDKYICQLCGKTQIEELEKLERKLAVHHIDYNKKNCDPKNLITLCGGCNSRVNNNRKHWTNYFKGRLSDLQELNK